jgi:hypothetical protein
LSGYTLTFRKTGLFGLDRALTHSVYLEVTGIAQAIPSRCPVYLGYLSLLEEQISRKEMASMVNNTANSQWFGVSRLRQDMTFTCAYGHAVPIDPHVLIAPFGGLDGISVPISWGSPPIIS